MALNRRGFLASSAAALAGGLPAIRITDALAADGFVELTAEKSEYKLYQAGTSTSDLWLFNGQSPGPELRVKKGELVKVRLINNLDEGTSIHWHGIRIANAMDGVSGLTQEAVPPGKSFEYEFIAPDAGTYWYHAHNRSWYQVARGLYGPLIVEEPDTPFDRNHDITLVIDDWRIDKDGRMEVESLGSLGDWSHGGRLGNWPTVNGERSPKFSLNSNKHYRIRLINACNARIFKFDLNNFGAKVLAYDGQPLQQPQTLSASQMFLGPAQRVDLLVTPEADGSFSLDDVSGDQRFALADFEVKDNGSPANFSGTLQQNQLPEPNLNDAKTFRLDMTGGAMGRAVQTVYNGRILKREDLRITRQLWAFNGIANLAEEPFFRVRQGETVIIETINNTAFPHAMHTHGHHFRILDEDGGVAENDQSWRDTFMIAPEQTLKIAFVADNPGKWLLHCHMLEHAAAGMNTWIEVS